MRGHAPFVVKRLAPMIGMADSSRRVTVEGNAFTLDEAMARARSIGERRHTLARMKETDGDPHGWITRKIRELDRTATWIERRGQSATLARNRSARGGGAP